VSILSAVALVISDVSDDDALNKAVVAAADDSGWTTAPPDTDAYADLHTSMSTDGDRKRWVWFEEFEGVAHHQSPMATALAKRGFLCRVFVVSLNRESYRLGDNDEHGWDIGLAPVEWTLSERNGKCRS